MAKIKESDVGRWVMVKWSDVGRQEAILVDFEPCKVYIPHSYGTQSVEADQIIELGPYIERGE